MTVTARLAVLAALSDWTFAQYAFPLWLGTRLAASWVTPPFCPASPGGASFGAVLTALL